MAVFDVNDFEKVITHVIEGNFITLSRNRLEFRVIRKDSETPESGKFSIIFT